MADPKIGLDSVITLIAKNLRNDEFFVKVAELIDFETDTYKNEFADVRFKFQDPTQLREEAIKEIVNEFGFEYLRRLMDTLAEVEFNVLVDFISLLNLLKGSRRGLETVLRLIGLDSIITEWWEASPQQEEFTYDLTVIATNSIVPDFNDTLEKTEVFVRHYIAAKLRLIQIRFLLGSFFEETVAIGGFVRAREFGKITAKI
jgi:hypothetical protein